MLRRAGRRRRSRMQVPVERLLERDGIAVAERPPLLLEPHHQRLRRVLVQKSKHVQQHVLEVEPREPVGVVDPQRVVLQPRAHVKVPQPGVELRREVEILALQALRVGEHVDAVGHGVVGARDGERRQRRGVGDGLHPPRVEGEVGVERVRREEAAVAARRARHGAGRYGEEGEEGDGEGGEEEDDVTGGQEAAAWWSRREEFVPHRLIQI